MSPPRSPPQLDMHKFRDPLFTYEACNADDVRRPRWALGRPSYRLALDVARGLCREDANRHVIGELVRSATGRESTGTVLYERFACGRLVRQEISAPDASPRPGPYGEPAAPLAELIEDGPAEDVPRVYGRCDVRGRDADNKALSDRRARAVLSRLTADLSRYELDDATKAAIRDTDDAGLRVFPWSAGRPTSDRGIGRADHRIVNLLGREPHYPKGAVSP